ncbi:MAG: mechanosensitive ion channel [Thioalkalispiraceae bacterium]|jgi:small-conductance mechanosensitive channel
MNKSDLMIAVQVSLDSIEKGFMFKKVLLILVSFLIVSVALAEQVEPTPAEALVNEIKAQEQQLKSRTLDVSGIRKINQKLTSLEAKAQECIDKSQKNVAEKKASLESLGTKHKKEAPELIKQRKEQEKDLNQAETELATCNAMLLRIQTALDTAEKQLQKILETQLLAKHDNILTVLNKYRKAPVSWFSETWSYGLQHSWIKTAEQYQIWTLIAIVLLSVICGLLIYRFLTPVIQGIHWTSEQSGRFAASLLGTFCHEAPYLFASIALTVTISIYTKGMTPVPLITTAANGLAFLFIARYVINFSLSPYAPGKLFINIKPEIACALARRLKVLTVVMLLGYLLIDSLLKTSLPEHMLSLARTTIRLAFAVNLIWILWLLKDLRGILQHSWLRYGLSLVLVVAILADLSGYTNLSGWLMRSVFGSLFTIVVILILGRLSSELLEGLEYGYTSWQRRTRRILGLTPEGHITGFFWIRLLVNLGWWALLMLMLIFIWDLSASVVEQIKVIFTNGFTVGSLKVVPARIVFALVSLGVLVTLSAWFQGQMRKRWVSKMPMERGAREAMVTMIGYAGVAIAILVTLGIAGIEYANLAIIAGALSLGIGFGLQNIVNNFVSGLILLFERPVKTGDWIVVGNTEGHVKQIRIRATQIETFDRADVIVPNSELISGQVTNWMLHDPRGRARIPVGVAYGSDTQKVKEILMKVAEDHPEVIGGGSIPKPVVLFRQFGDSSLDFELRCFIKDVDNRLSVISDLNFAIDAAFRENGIEIPFPQRDLHMKNWPAKGDGGDFENE